MAQRKLKDFDKEKMYSKIMPSFAGRPAQEEESGNRHAAPLMEREGDRYVLRNFIEDIVNEKVERTIDMLRGCHCERCRKDVMALALAELPTVYRVVERDRLGETLGQVRLDYEVKASAALIKAVQVVKNSPNHDREEHHHGG